MYNAEDMRLKSWIFGIACTTYDEFKHRAHKALLQYGDGCIPEDFLNGRNHCWTWLCGHFVSPGFKVRVDLNLILI